MAVVAALWSAGCQSRPANNDVTNTNINTRPGGHDMSNMNGMSNMDHDMTKMNGHDMTNMNSDQPEIEQMKKWQAVWEK